MHSLVQTTHQSDSYTYQMLVGITNGKRQTSGKFQRYQHSHTHTHTPIQKLPVFTTWTILQCILTSNAPCVSINRTHTYYVWEFYFFFYFANPIENYSLVGFVSCIQSQSRFHRVKTCLVQGRKVTNGFRNMKY